MDDFSKWKQLKHDRILPLYGVTYGFGPAPAIVSPWMHNGSLSIYLDKHYNDLTQTHKFTLVSAASNNTALKLMTVIQLVDVAAGLQYRMPCHFAMNRDRLIHCV